MAGTVAAEMGGGPVGAGHGRVTRVAGSRVAADLARSAWLAAYARGLAASPACNGDAPNELLRAAEHDVDLLRVTRRRMPEEPARELVTEALRRLEAATSGMDLEATRELLLGQAKLFEHPADYAAGVRDAFEALVPMLDARRALVPEVIDVTDGATPADQPGEAANQ